MQFLDGRRHVRWCASDRCWFRQYQTAETGLTVQTVQKTRDSIVQFWEGVDTPVGVQTTGPWFRQSEHWALCLVRR